MRAILILAAAAALAPGPALAQTQTIEAVGGEKCSPGRGPFTVTFVAPEEAQLEATAKAKNAQGEADPAQDTANLELDGKACAKATCRFKASKGQSYHFKATATTRGPSNVCITVARPT